MNTNIDSVKKRTYDAIVIGSGASGGWAAKELTQKGLKTLMLERGRPLEHITGYESAMLHPWELKYRDRITAEQRRTHPFLSRDYPYNEANNSYWFDDIDAPYEEKHQFDWYRPNIVGGKSIMWGRQSYRYSDLDFEANLKDGIAVDWPIRYKDLAPWYEHVEKHVGISGEALGLPQLPDSVFLPPMDMNCVEQHVSKSIKKNFAGRNLTIGRVANLTQPHNGRGSCQYRNLCSRGCPFSGYFSTQSSTLQPAMETGRLTLRANSVVTSIIYDEKKGRATGVRVLDSETLKETEFYAKIIFLNASTISTTHILMNSTSSRFENGFGNDSGELGHNLMDHHFRCGAEGVAEGIGFDDKYTSGRRPNGVYVPRYQNIGTDKRDFLRGFGYQGGASRQGWQRTVAEAGFGEELKARATTPGPWRMGIMGFGECLPYHDNQMTLNREHLDKWGMPAVVFDAIFRENEAKMRKAMQSDAVEMLEAAGIKNVRAYDNGSFPGTAIHEMGTARMGRDPKTSILNEWNQVHAAKNVFVTDGAAMTSIACVNPTLTLMALTARAADYAVNELKKQNL